MTTRHSRPRPRISRSSFLSSGTEYPSPRLPNDPKNERSLRTWAEVVPPRDASSPELTVPMPCPSNSSRKRRYSERRRTVDSATLRIQRLTLCEMFHKVTVYATLRQRVRGGASRNPRESAFPAWRLDLWRHAPVVLRLGPAPSR